MMSNKNYIESIIVVISVIGLFFLSQMFYDSLSTSGPEYEITDNEQECISTGESYC